MSPDSRNRIVYVRDVSTTSFVSDGKVVKSRGAPRGVLVYNVSPSNTDGCVRVSFGASYCNRGEQFSCHRGVQIASGRLHKRPFTMDVKSGLRPFEVERLLMSLLVDDFETTVPKWADVGNDALKVTKRYLKYLNTQSA